MATDLLRQTRDYFKAQGIAEVDASILLEHLLECQRGEVQLRLLRLSAEEIQTLDRELRRLVLRRQNGEPVQYITGRAPFRYLEYEVGPGVLIPRPETETLVSLVLEMTKELLDREVSLVDLGSGSGCIAISLATERKNFKVTAVESAPLALPWLRKNVLRLSPGLRVIEADVSLASQGETFDIVVANPPYIPQSQLLPIEVRKEPAEALFGGGASGLEAPTHFISAAVRLLNAGGLLALEHDETQGGAIAEILSQNFVEINLVNDLTGRPRFTTARKV